MAKRRRRGLLWVVLGVAMACWEDFFFPALLCFFRAFFDLAMLVRVVEKMGRVIGMKLKYVRILCPWKYGPSIEGQGKFRFCFSNFRSQP